MHSSKIGAALLLLAVAYATAVNVPATVSDKLKYDVEEKSAVPVSTTLADPEPKDNKTSTPEPSTKPSPPNTTVVPTTSTPAPTTAPNTTVSPTTTPTPNTTTTTSAPPITSSTHSPNVTTTVAPSPNVTTTVAPPAPTPTPTPGRTWDGPSFFGGMVLSFGLVGIGYVGYRFFYLGRGGAYHTL